MKKLKELKELKRVRRTVVGVVERSRCRKVNVMGEKKLAMKFARGREIRRERHSQVQEKTIL